MINSNLYATLNDYKAFVISRGQTASADATDDAVILDLLEQACRFLDDQIGSHVFYPSVITRLYNATPNRYILLGADLLEVTSFLNGNAVAVTTADYLLDDVNNFPKFGIFLRDTSSIIWYPNTYASFQQAISLTGVWGWHDDYNNAWVQAGTLGAAITDTTGLSVTMTAGHALATGQIWKIGSEIVQGSVSVNTLTLNKRGDNGSTTATHLNGAAVYYWKPVHLAKMSALEIAHYAYERRYGKSVDSSATVTAAGIVLSPRDIPTMAQKFIKSFII